MICDGPLCRNRKLPDWGWSISDRGLAKEKANYEKAVKKNRCFKVVTTKNENGGYYASAHKIDTPKEHFKEYCHDDAYLSHIERLCKRRLSQ